MAQTTRTPRTARTARTPRTTPRAGTGRFARPGAAQTRSNRFPRAGAPQARTGRMPSVRRKPPQKKGIASAITGLLPTGAASKATPSSKKGKAGGFAAIAAAAGVAFRNRDKLAGMLNRKGGSQNSQSVPPTPGTTADAVPPRPADTTL